MKNGILCYLQDKEKFAIAIENYGITELSCGTTFDIFIDNNWVSTRIEYSNDWYLVGIKTSIYDIDGAKVKISW